MLKKYFFTYGMKWLLDVNMYLILLTDTKMTLEIINLMNRKLMYIMSCKDYSAVNEANPMRY